MSQIRALKGEGVFVCALEETKTVMSCWGGCSGGGKGERGTSVSEV